ncbi:MAG: hypothetical protein DMG05_02785 [Acidobacteria bacterium]|nr:MAG: hypothetical protein DMG05_02785 [Acidobacteriota bacterium]
MVTRTHLMLLLGLTSALIATWTYGSYHPAKTSAEMATAARGFLAALNPEQKVKASLKFEDDERMRWHFIPDSMWPRKGIPFKELDGAQRKLAHSFLSTGLSRRGYLKATTIMSLEAILKELEQGKGPVRDSDLYFFSIFGEPLETQTWGWRVEGHHLSLNFTVVKGELIATAPTFFGSNPAEVKAGPRQGLRVLAKEEDLARELLHSLDESHRSLAIIMKAAPDDIITKNSRRVEPSSPAGLPASQMTQKQKDQLMTLLEEYAHNMPEELAAGELEKLHQAGVDKIHFAWAGGLNRGERHYYRIQGPTFLVEYDNTQNNANHIHTVWRSFDGDFGVDLLRLHYEQDHTKR